MGEGVWMSLNGGLLTQTTQKGYDDLGSDSKDLFQTSEIRTGGIGIVDAAFRTPTEAWAVGGSGVIYVTKDGGKTGHLTHLATNCHATCTPSSSSTRARWAT